MGQAGRNLTVTCDYNIEYKKHRKWWCRKTVLMHCHNRVHTTGVEQVVRKDRVTIRDDQGQHRFTITMERLRDNDRGTYWCGVDTDKFDLAFPVRVTIAPAPTSALTTISMSTMTTMTTDTPTTTATTEEITDTLSVTRTLSNTT
ncbi:CMRF35-like molecule 1 [Sorex araneus]|uniref:CMRF35-like molecule 1 n=1 Tax=Sorex araneus TaxID=42254 RepID=UPI00243368FD|nr:CMRF35-like molecule 1 [Sorex araneus]